MKLSLSLLAASLIAISGAAHAGPPVTITFKNQGSAAATYTVVTVNHITTNTYANPKPKATVDPQDSDSYSVQNPISANANAANVRYTMGSKTCQFSTNYMRLPGSSGVLLPQWNKAATPSGGAICTATITATNPSTHAWSVEFTMR